MIYSSLTIGHPQFPWVIKNAPTDGMNRDSRWLRAGQRQEEWAGVLTGDPAKGEGPRVSLLAHTDSRCLHPLEYFYPVATLSPQVVTTKNVSRLCQTCLGGEIAGVEEPCQSCNVQKTFAQVQDLTIWECWFPSLLYHPELAAVE